MKMCKERVGIVSTNTKKGPRDGVRKRQGGAPSLLLLFARTPLPQDHPTMERTSSGQNKITCTYRVTLDRV